MPLARVALKGRYLTLGVAGFFLLVSVAPITGGLLKFQAFPSLDSDTIEARLLLTPGAPLWQTEQRVETIRAALAKLNEELTPLQPGEQPLVRNVTVRYGVNADAKENGPHLATISADLLRGKNAPRSSM